MAREVVIWSGGVDSTLVLHKLATNSTEHWPVVALTVEAHPQMDKGQFTGQYHAQQAYLKLAKERGHHVKHVRVSITHSENSTTTGDNAQASVWFGMAMLYIENGDRVHMGYIRPDDFWHSKSEFLALFEAFCKFREIKAEVVFDLEYVKKVGVVEELRRFKIPPECVWTCDRPVQIKKDWQQCGVCDKCKTLLETCKNLPPPLKKQKVVKLVGTPIKGKEFRPPKFRW